MVTKTDKERRKAARTMKKEANAARRAESVKRAESKRKIREQNGGAGLKILVFDRQLKPTAAKKYKSRR